MFEDDCISISVVKVTENTVEIVIERENSKNNIVENNMENIMVGIIVKMVYIAIYKFDAILIPNEQPHIFKGDSIVYTSILFEESSAISKYLEILQG